MRVTKFGFALCFFLCFAEGEALSQAVRVGKGRVWPTVTGGGAITVTAAPALVSFPLASQGVAAADSGVVVTTTWTGHNRLSALNLYGYFSRAGAALTGGSPAVNIPSSAVLGRLSTGSTPIYTPFTQSNPIAGASLLLYCELFLAGSNGSRIDTLNMEINLTDLPQLPAGSYTGTLYLQAQML